VISIQLEQAGEFIAFDLFCPEGANDEVSQGDH
jgi:hypothetical protein